MTRRFYRLAPATVYLLPFKYLKGSHDGNPPVSR